MRNCCCTICTDFDCNCHTAITILRIAEFAFCLLLKSASNGIMQNFEIYCFYIFIQSIEYYFIVRQKVDQRAGQLCLPHVIDCAYLKK